jgi:flagellar basal-body rod modification protein FlgD
METTAITSGATTTAAVQNQGFEGLNSDDFFKLLIAQLSNQDPLEPTSNQELLNQISSIRDIQASTSLTRTLDNLANRQGFGSAAALIGQYVSGTQTAADGTTAAVSGQVVGLRIDPSGSTLLMLDSGNELALNSVEQVTNPAQFAAALKGRWISGLERSNPNNPTLVEGIVTGVSTDSSGKITLDLDNGAKVGLADVESVTCPDGTCGTTGTAG